MVKLETDRLIIRDHIIEDIDSLHSVLSSENVMHYLPDLKTSTYDESWENINVAINEAMSNHRQKYFFAIIIKETKEYVGEIGLDTTIDSPEGKVVNLGYFILEKFWGKGIVTEAARAVVKFAFEKAGAIKIETGCIKDNFGSERVMKKIGMKKEAEFKKHVLLGSKLYDRVEYRLLREEWESL